MLADWIRRGLLAVLLASVVALGLARAELPPSYYEQLRADAPERLTIRVVSVESWPPNDARPRITAVLVRAEVLAVDRTESGLSPGETIRIRYTSRRLREGETGPGPIPVVARGRDYRAYLSLADEARHYRPAARAASFERVRAK